MNINTLYSPIHNDKEAEFLLAPKTLNNYKKLMHVMINSSNVSASQKEAYKKQMGWKDDKVSDQYNLEEHYYECAKVVFQGFEKHVTGKDELDLSMSQIEKGTADFLLQ